MVHLEACHGVADKFVLSDNAVTALADFKRCERERYDLLKKAEMDSAEEKRNEGDALLGMIQKLRTVSSPSKNNDRSIRLQKPEVRSKVVFFLKIKLLSFITVMQPCDK